MLFEMRKQAKTEGEKQLIKLIMNAIIGYTIMFKGGHIRLEVLTEALTREILQRRRDCPTHMWDCVMGSLHYFMNDKTIIKEDLPSAVGITVYDLSKLIVIKHIDTIQDAMQKRGLETTLVYSDTDSAVLSICGKDARDNWVQFNKEHGDMFVHTCYPRWSTMYNAQNDKQPNTMEEEHPPVASDGVCKGCRCEVMACWDCDAKDREGKNPCGGMCDKHEAATSACSDCCELRDVFGRLPSTLWRFTASGPKSYQADWLTADKIEKKVTNRGATKSTRKRAAEDNAYDEWYKQGTEYHTKQARLGHTSLQQAARQQRMIDDDATPQNPIRIDTKLYGTDDKKRTVIRQGGSEKGYLHLVCCERHSAGFDMTCRACRRIIRPFGHYTNHK